MTVYPFIIHFGRFAITGYGIMMMLSFLMAGWIFARRLQEQGKDPATAWDCVVAAVLGGLIGAKVYYTVLVGDWGALLSRGGLVWYGGFAGGVLGVSAYLFWRKVPILPAADSAAPALAAGYSVGRVGCFLVGDDYGLPTLLPWGVAFPQGSPPTTARVLTETFHVALPPGMRPEEVLAVHPTQLYEVALAFVAFVLLWRLRKAPRGTGWLFGWYLLFAGLARLLVEAFRAKDDRFFGALTLAQLLSVAVAATGVWCIVRARRARA